MYDVAIIGAGVTGSYLAYELVKLGHSTCVIEKHPDSGHKTCCTGIISNECLTLLDLESYPIQHESHSAKIFSPSGNCLHIERDATQAYVLDRPSLDRLLASRAANKGVEYSYNTCVSDVKILDKKAQLKGSKNGEPVFIDARSVIIASGFSSGLTSKAGLGRCMDMAYGAQTEVDGNGIGEVEIYSGSHLAPGFFGWLVPTGKNRVKAGLLSKHNPKSCMAKFLNAMGACGKIKTDGCHVSYGGVPLRPLRNTYADRLLVVGDAAGQVKSTTGGGIFFGLLCARISAATLHQALVNDDLSARKLSQYQKNWHRLLKQELDIDYWAHRFYSSLNDKQIEHVFNIIERHKIHETILTSPDITFDWHSKAILDVIKHRSLQRSLEKLSPKPLMFTDKK